MASRNYRDLIAWQKAMNLVAEVYRLSTSFPRPELYGLTAQLRRAAVSIPSNIAEGQGRGGDPEFVRFLRIAHGSLNEVETQLLIAERLGYTERKLVNPLIDMSAEIGRLINGLVRSKTQAAAAEPAH
jgi:four helix bundle protein